MGKLENIFLRILDMRGVNPLNTSKVAQLTRVLAILVNLVLLVSILSCLFLYKMDVYTILETITGISSLQQVYLFII